MDEEHSLDSTNEGRGKEAGEGEGRRKRGEETVVKMREMVEGMNRGRMYLRSIETKDLWRKEKWMDFVFFFIQI